MEGVIDLTADEEAGPSCCTARTTRPSEADPRTTRAPAHRPKVGRCCGQFRGEMEIAKLLSEKFDIHPDDLMLHHEEAKADSWSYYDPRTSRRESLGAQQFQELAQFGVGRLQGREAGAAATASCRRNADNAGRSWRWHSGACACRAPEGFVRIRHTQGTSRCNCGKWQIRGIPGGGLDGQCRMHHWHVEPDGTRRLAQCPHRLEGFRNGHRAHVHDHPDDKEEEKTFYLAPCCKRCNDLHGRIMYVRSEVLVRIPDESTFAELGLDVSNYNRSICRCDFRRMQNSKKYDTQEALTASQNELRYSLFEEIPPMPKLLREALQENAFKRGRLSERALAEDREEGVVLVDLSAAVLAASRAASRAAAEAEYDGLQAQVRRWWASFAGDAPLPESLMHQHVPGYQHRRQAPFANAGPGRVLQEKADPDPELEAALAASRAPPPDDDDDSEARFEAQFEAALAASRAASRAPPDDDEAAMAAVLAQSVATAARDEQERARREQAEVDAATAASLRDAPPAALPEDEPPPPLAREPPPPTQDPSPHPTLSSAGSMPEEAEAEAVPVVFSSLSQDETNQPRRRRRERQTGAAPASEAYKRCRSAREVARDACVFT